MRASYPEISGFFVIGGIFLGNLFLEKYLAKNLGNPQGAVKYCLGDVHWQAEACNVFVKHLSARNSKFY